MEADAVAVAEELKAAAFEEPEERRDRRPVDPLQALGGFAPSWFTIIAAPSNWTGDLIGRRGARNGSWENGVYVYFGQIAHGRIKAVEAVRSAVRLGPA